MLVLVSRTSNKNAGTKNVYLPLGVAEMRWNSAMGTCRCPCTAATVSKHEQQYNLCYFINFGS